MKNLTEEKLKVLYLGDKKSVAEIAKIFKCSERGIDYWLKKYIIPKRTISEAAYVKWNPNGDPFKIKEKFNNKEIELRGIGLGIYWGEGDKSPNNTSVRVSNTDPFLIRKFRDFLRGIYNVKEEKIQYGLILFNDSKKSRAIKFWENHLEIKRNQLGKITIIPPQGKGKYRKKSEYGVITIIFTNKKLKEHILTEIRNI